MRILRILLTALVILAVALPVQAASSVTLGLTAESPTLGSPIRYALYTPNEAPPEGERWPVLYLLHGLGATDSQWFANGQLQAMLDEAIAAGTIRPLVVAAPYAGDSWYVDSSPGSGFGPIDTALATDLVAAIDASLPTAACRSGRAVAGISMGGAGAVLQAINHPELYTAAIGYSPALHRPVSAADVRPGAMADPYGGAFGSPFDPDAFNKANAFTRAANLRDAAQPPQFYFVIGDDDYPELLENTVMFHNLLKSHGITSVLHVSPGRHNWAFWQRVIVPALAWLSPLLDPECARR